MTVIQGQPGYLMGSQRQTPPDTTVASFQRELRPEHPTHLFRTRSRLRPGLQAPIPGSLRSPAAGFWQDAQPQLVPRLSEHLSVFCMGDQTLCKQ